MKTFDLFLTVIVSLLFSSCDKEYDNTTSLYFRTIIPKEEFALRNSDLESSITDSSEFVVLFTGLEIEWFNGKTRELRLKKNVSFYLVRNISFCLNEEVLFELSVTSFAMSYTLDYPVLIYGIGDNKLHIGKGYPDWEYWTHPIDCSTWYEFGGYCWMEEREKNWKAIEPGWNKFIEQLKKEGLYRE